MNKRLWLLGLPLILMVSVLTGISPLPQTVHAMTGCPNAEAICPTGTVCITDSSTVVAGTNPCPTAPFNFTGPIPPSPETAPEQIRVGVYVAGSAGVNGFTIILNASFTFLHPADVDLTGTVLLGTPSVLAECLSGTLIHGSACSGADNINTLEFSATSALGEPSTPTPTTGLLFTAIYNVTGATPAGGIPIKFATNAAFCGSTSVSGNVCADIANNTPNPDPERIPTYTNMFDSSTCATTCTWFAVTTNTTSVTVNQGALTGNAVNVTAIAPQGLPVFGTTYVNFSTVLVPSGFGSPLFGSSPTFQCSTFTMTAPIKCSTIMTISTATEGTFTVTVKGLYHGDNCGTGGACNKVTHTIVGVVNILVNILVIRSLSWNVNGQSATSAQTPEYKKGASSLVNVFTSLGGYSGTITLTQSACNGGTTGVTCPLALPPAFSIGPGQTITKLINFTATGYGDIVYRDVMTPTGVTAVTSTTLSILINGFSETANVTSVSFDSGGSGVAKVTVKSLGIISGTTNAKFSGSVTISTSSSPSGLTISCNPTSVSVPASDNANTTCTFRGTVVTTTTFTAFVNGIGGTDNLTTNSTSISVTVTRVSPAPTTTALICTSSCTATVSTASGTPTGTVSFTTNSTGVFSSTTCTLISGSCSVTYRPTTTGHHNITATYGGDASHSGSAGKFLIAVTPRTTTTTVVCLPTSTPDNTPTSCTATVIDSSGTGTVGPTGTVTFTTNSTGSFSSTTCNLTPGSGSSMSTCVVSYTPNVLGNHRITAAYRGDQSHDVSSGSFVVHVGKALGVGSTFLIFSGVDLDDFHNGMGQLEVLVNGQVAVDVPAGINHLTGSGDFSAYTHTRVLFGPFDISSFLISGQNTITFLDPINHYFDSIHNIVVFQGSASLLSVKWIGVYSGHSATFTFSA